MWIKRNTLERKLADAMGYEYCTLFDTARSALRALFKDSKSKKYLPSNVCPELVDALPHHEVALLPVSPATGLSGAPVQLYGYRQIFSYSYCEIDPLMTGFLREPNAPNCIISFGHKKMLDAGGGGAYLSNEKFKGYTYFPEFLRFRIECGLEDLPRRIDRQRDNIDNWDRLLGDSCIRILQEQIMPWRVMRRIPEKRDTVVKALRDAGHPVGTNYPPLPGVTDPGAIQWGKEVVNFFPDWPHTKEACEIVKRVLEQ